MPPQECAAGLARRVAELIAEIGSFRQGAERGIDKERREIVPSTRIWVRMPTRMSVRGVRPCGQGWRASRPDGGVEVDQGKRPV